MANLNRLSATEAARKLAAREITAQALLADCIERIRERDPVVHAWTFVDIDGATARARQLDAQAVSGLLHGLPVAVKDLFDTFDMGYPLDHAMRSKLGLIIPVIRTRARNDLWHPAVRVEKGICALKPASIAGRRYPPSRPAMMPG